MGRVPSGPYAAINCGFSRRLHRFLNDGANAKRLYTGRIFRSQRVRPYGWGHSRMADLCDGCKSRAAQKGTGCCGRASQSRLQHYRLPGRLLSGGSSAKGNTAQCPSLIATSADFQGRFRLTSKAALFCCLLRSGTHNPIHVCYDHTQKRKAQIP